MQWHVQCWHSEGQTPLIIYHNKKEKGKWSILRLMKDGFVQVTPKWCSDWNLKKFLKPAKAIFNKFVFTLSLSNLCMLYLCLFGMVVSSPPTIHLIIRFASEDYAFSPWQAFSACSPPLSRSQDHIAGTLTTLHNLWCSNVAIICSFAANKTCIQRKCFQLK